MRCGVAKVCGVTSAPALVVVARRRPHDIHSNGRSARRDRRGMVSSLVLASGALAGPPHTVSVNGSTSGDHPFYAATTSQGWVKINGHNSAGDVVFGCTSGALAGRTQAGPAASDNPIVTISGSSWRGCVTVGLDLKFTQIGPWGLYLDPAGQPTTPGFTDAVAGRIRAVSGTAMASVQDVLTSGALCSFIIIYTGNGVVGNFTESNQQFNMSEVAGNLEVPTCQAASVM